MATLQLCHRAFIFWVGAESSLATLIGAQILRSMVLFSSRVKNLTNCFGVVSWQKRTPCGLWATVRAILWYVMNLAWNQPQSDLFISFFFFAAALQQARSSGRWMKKKKCGFARRATFWSHKFIVQWWMSASCSNVSLFITPTGRCPGWAKETRGQPQLCPHRHCHVSHRHHDHQSADPGKLFWRGSLQRLSQTRLLWLWREQQGHLLEDQHVGHQKGPWLLWHCSDHGESYFY